MNQLILICAPIGTRSGYGEHSRDLFHALNDMGKYDIKIFDVPWGNTPRNSLDSKNEQDKKIIDCILSEPNLSRQPDIYIDIRIPNEFQQHGKFNIGITAGIETNAVSGKWLECCNKMDLIIVPSEHSKKGFTNTIYDAVRNLPDGKQQKMGDLKLQKPIEVLFEGAEENDYRPLEKDEMNQEFFDKINKLIPEKFAFLFVGQWTGGGYGEDRKDIGKLIKVFYEAFANKKKQPALVLKTSGATFSILDKEEILNKIQTVKNQFPKDWNLPNVYLLHGDLTKSEMNNLYNHPKMKIMVSFTHGEGFGRPLLEASMMGLPIIVSSWSGQIDFLNSEYVMLLPGKLEKVPKSALWKDIIIPESQWFMINEQEGYKALNFAFENYETEVKKRGKKLMRENREKFTLKKMTEKFEKIMKQYTNNLPSAVSLNLPKLKKVGDNQTKIPKIKLPKLNKITKDK